MVRNGDAEQINFQVPWELQPGTQARLQLISGAAQSEPVDLPVTALSPGVFSANASDALVIRAADFTLADRGLRRGEPYLIYATGLGLMDLPVATGAALSQPARLRRGASLRIAGVSCDIDYAGAAPGFVGVYQLNFRIPAAVPAGTQDLVLTVDQLDAPGRKVLILN